MRIPIDRQSATPLYQQIVEFLRCEIQSGALPGDTRLPSSRALAASLDLNRITVANAYAVLESEGLLYSRLGSGTFVSPGRSTAPAEKAAVNWPLWQHTLREKTELPNQREREFLAAYADDSTDLISFASGTGAEDLYPVGEFRRALDQVLRRDKQAAMDYGEAAGFLPLRHTIAHILTSQGIHTDPAQILITSGSQQALLLVASLILRPGDPILVENPTYSNAIDLFTSLGAHLVGVPMDDQGLRLDLLEDLLRTVHPRLIYVIPTFHNPTGTCLSSARRRRLVTLADRYNIPILEDEFVGDLRFEGRALPPLKALAPPGRVIYLGTFSKVLMPSLRIGYLVAAGPVFEQLVQWKRLNDLTSSSLIQRALHAYITVGRYETHLHRLIRTYRLKRDAMLEALQRYMPSGVSWNTPQGGLYIWLKLPQGLTDQQVFKHAWSQGVRVSPGSLFFTPEAREPAYLRMNFTTNSPERIAEGICRLAEAINQALAETVQPELEKPAI